MNSNEYLDWILTQKAVGYTAVRKDKDHITLDSEKISGFVNIYHLEADIVELRLEWKDTQENVFFLHFELNDEEHAKTLFQEMTDMLNRQNKKQITKVLLSCTSGLTTSFFAEKLKEAAEILSLDFTFSAVAFSSLYASAEEYDVILLAPQIAYKHKEVSDTLWYKVVMNIPPQIFASYDTGAMCDLIEKELHDRSVTKEKQAAARVMRDITTNACIFVITMTSEVHRTRYYYRLYDKGDTVFSEEVIKWESSVEDIIDILDTEFTAFRKNYDIAAVSIAMPGVILEAGLSSSSDYDALAEKLKDRYDIPVYVQHNTEAVAYGYYAGQTKYDIIAYHSHPGGGLYGGQGMVYRGVPISGIHHRAGEITPLFRRFNTSFTGEMEYGTPEEIRSAVVSYLLTNIVTFDPEVILVRSEYTPDMDELKKELSAYIPEEKLPDLIYAEDVSEYACLGTMLCGLRRMQEEVFHTFLTEDEAVS